jgi:hypothetical protein
MTDATDNVMPLRPDIRPEPSRTPRTKDRRAAARKAKSRSKIKGDRDAKPDKALVPLPPVYAPPMAPMTQTANATRHGGHAVDVAAYTAAIALAGAAAFFSVKAISPALRIPLPTEQTNKQRTYAAKGQMLRGQCTCRFTAVEGDLGRYEFRR